MLRTIVGLAGVLLLMTAVGCAAATPLPSASSEVPTTSASIPAASAVSSAPSSTRAASSVRSTPSVTAADVIPWNSAGLRSVADLVPNMQPLPPAHLPGCDGAQFQLVPASARTTSTPGGSLTTTFVLQFTGSASCRMSGGLFGASMTSADGTVLPIDTLPSGPPPAVLTVGFHQVVFGSITWAVKQGRPHPAHLTFSVGDRSPAPAPITIPVAGVSIPIHPTDQSPQNVSASTVHGRLRFAADPGALATLTVDVRAPATIRVPATLKYQVTLLNSTGTAVPLDGCLGFVEQLSVVPVKLPTSVGARGTLNCARLPVAIAAHASVTMQMQLDTANEIAGPGELTWQMLNHDQIAAEAIVRVMVR